MSDERASDCPAIDERQSSDPFRPAVAGVAAAWLVGVLMLSLGCSAFGTADPTERAAVLSISLGSGVIAVAAVGVGSLFSRSRDARGKVDHDSESADSASSGSLVAAAMAGMTLRIVGTVALFLTCRYHLAAAAEAVVLLTLGWYLYLTTVELLILARELKRIDVAAPYHRDSPHRDSPHTTEIQRTTVPRRPTLETNCGSLSTADPSKS